MASVRVQGNGPVVPTRRKRLALGEAVPLSLTPAQRTLITENTFAGPDLTERLLAAETNNGKIVVTFTLDELDELIGYVAAEANHAKSRVLQRKLDRLCSDIERVQSLYYDNLSPEHFHNPM